jgi:hypothetical protein
MEEQPTCGKGLAENSVLPARLGAVIAVMADVLEAHVTALDVNDETVRPEYDAYTKLVDEQRDAAARLRAIAERMAGYRGLPIGPHDEAALAGREPLEAFQSFVGMKEELRDLLAEQINRDQQMLRQMRGASGGST